MIVSLAKAKVARRLARRTTKGLNAHSDSIASAIVRRPVTLQECAEIFSCKRSPPHRSTQVFIDGTVATIGMPRSVAKH